MMKNRKHMFRAFSFLLIAVMLFTLAACGNQGVSADSTSETVPVVEADESESETSEYVEEKPDSPMQTGLFHIENKAELR